MGPPRLPELDSVNFCRVTVLTACRGAERSVRLGHAYAADPGGGAYTGPV